MYVVVHLRQSPSVAVHTRSGQIPADVRAAAAQLGLSIRPMHPGVEDPALASTFYVEIPDQPAAERVITQLQQCTSVEAAYLKPPEGPP
jgi:hypothetical protein